jgi:RNA polymerase sigma factor
MANIRDNLTKDYRFFIPFTATNTTNPLGGYFMRKLHEKREEISRSGNNSLQKEIVVFKQLLQDYKITFSDLTNSSPQNADIRVEAIKAAKIISENPYLLTLLQDKKSLPAKELKKSPSICRKTLSKYKKYIIALILIFTGEFTFIKDYVNP